MELEMKPTTEQINLKRFVTKKVITETDMKEIWDESKNPLINGYFISVSSLYGRSGIGVENYPYLFMIFNENTYFDKYVWDSKKMDYTHVETLSFTHACNIFKTLPLPSPHILREFWKEVNKLKNTY